MIDRRIYNRRNPRLTDAEILEIVRLVDIYKDHAPKRIAAQFRVSHGYVMRLWQCHKHLQKNPKPKLRSILTTPTLNT